VTAPIEAVLFDWGGTLTPFHDIDLPELWRAAAEVLAPDRVDDLAAALVEVELACWDRTSGTMASFTVDDVLRAASESLGLDVEDAVHSLATDAYRGGWGPHLVARPDAVDVVRAVKGRGLRTGVLSNTHWPRHWHEEALAEDGLLEHLDARVYTSELAYMKPHPEAFGALLAAVDVDPLRSVFVGDRLYDDISGAQALGMRTVWIRNDRVPAYDVMPDAVIAELSELIAVIDDWR